MTGGKPPLSQAKIGKKRQATNDDDLADYHHDIDVNKDKGEMLGRGGQTVGAGGGNRIVAPSSSSSSTGVGDSSPFLPSSSSSSSLGRTPGTTNAATTVTATSSSSSSSGYKSIGKSTSRQALSSSQSSQQATSLSQSATTLQGYSKSSDTGGQGLGGGIGFGMSAASKRCWLEELKDRVEKNPLLLYAQVRDR